MDRLKAVIVHKIKYNNHMNIFCLDTDPRQAARWCMDKHVVKMPTESAQMLANCFTDLQLSKSDCPRTKTNNVRLHSYYNHRCSVWVRTSRANMMWLIEHAIELCNEKLKRYPQNPDHRERQFILWAVKNIDISSVPEGKLTDFPLAINIDCNCRKIYDFLRLDRVSQYRLYYIHDKQHIAHWKCNKPEWYK